MLGFFKFLFFCLLAIAAGVAAVSVPVAGKTVAAHVQALSAELLAEETPARPVAGKRAAARPPSPAAAPAPKKKARPPESDPTPAERAALDDLIDARTARKPAPGR